jgi:pimeloyl-ACP methyl ester carboxylesterase
MTFSALLLILGLTSSVNLSQPAQSDLRIAVDGAELAATLTVPAGDHRHPAVLLLAGSGPSTRQGLRRFADHFTRLGFATLVFDKRGSGQSTGSWTTASLADMVADAKAAIAVLQEDPRIDPARIGVWGVSQAGWFVPVLAEQTPTLAFAMVLTGGGATPQEGTPWLAALGIEGVMPSDANRPSWEWVARFDPAPYIARMRVPTLVLLGAEDLMGSPTVAAERWTQGLAAANNTKSFVEIVPGMGHAATIGSQHEQGGATLPDYFSAVERFVRALGILPRSPTLME